MKELVATAEYWGPIAEFMNEIKRIATATQPPKFTESGIFADDEERPVVFIHAGIEDAKQAGQISDILKTMNCFPLVPITDGRPDVLRKNEAAKLAACDGLVFVYGQVDPTWVLEQFLKLPRVIAQRMKLDPPKPLRGLAICNVDPPDKPHPGVDAKGLKWFDGTSGLKPEELREWLVSLKTDVAP